MILLLATAHLVNADRSEAHVTGIPVIGGGIKSGGQIDIVLEPAFSNHFTEGCILGCFYYLKNEWERCSGGSLPSGCTVVLRTESSTYHLTGADVGSYIRVRVRRVDERDGGYTEQTSNPWGPIQPA